MYLKHLKLRHIFWTMQLMKSKIFKLQQLFRSHLFWKRSFEKSRTNDKNNNRLIQNKPHHNKHNSFRIQIEEWKTTKMCRTRRKSGKTRKPKNPPKRPTLGTGPGCFRRCSSRGRSPYSGKGWRGTWSLETFASPQTATIRSPSPTNSKSRWLLIFYVWNFQFRHVCFYILALCLFRSMWFFRIWQTFIICIDFRNWFREIEKCNVSGKQPSLLRALIRTFLPSFIFDGFLQFIQAIFCKWVLITLLR